MNMVPLYKTVKTIALAFRNRSFNPVHATLFTQKRRSFVWRHLVEWRMTIRMGCYRAV